MKMLLPLILGTLTLQLSATALSAELMATVTSSKGTTRIETAAAANAYFFAPYIFINDGSGPRYNDFLLPAAMGSSQLTVSNGYCAAVASATDFTGSKPRVFGPGSYSVKNYLGFSNGIQGIAVYASSGASCNLNYDLPLFNTPDGKNSRPLAPNSKQVVPRSSTTVFDGEWIALLNDVIFGRFSSSGKFPMKNAILTVPSCHSVTLDAAFNQRKTYNAGGHADISATYPNGLDSAHLTAIKADCKKPSTLQRSTKGALIRHNGNNLCLNPEGGGVPTYDTRAVLTSNCSATDPGNKFRMLFDGTIQHVESGMCLHPRGGSSTPGNGTELVFWPACGANSGSAGAYIRFENTLKDSLRQLSSGSCLHPNGGSPTPANGTKVVFWQGCNEDRLRFTFDAQ